MSFDNGFNTPRSIFGLAVLCVAIVSSIAWAILKTTGAI